MKQNSLIKRKIKKENLEIAKTLMKGEWFYQSCYNSTINSIDKLGLPYFDEIRQMCEEREVEHEECDDESYECPNDYDCEHCAHNVIVKSKQYKFLDADERTPEEYEEQIDVLKYFNII